MRSCILIKKLGEFYETSKSQYFVFQWDPTFDRLVDFRERVTVEQQQIDERNKRRSQYELINKEGNENYNDLSNAGVTIKDTHFLMYNRSGAIV